MKSFKDIVAGEKLYVLEPLTNKIQETKVLESFKHPKSLTGKVWVLKILKLSKIEKITEETLEKAKEYGSDVTLQILVDADESMVLLKFPNEKVSVTVVSTDENKLRRWIEKPSKEVSEMLKLLKHSR